LPLRLKIPKINVDATIEYVGLRSNGEMDVPKDTANVAWFNLGPPPGQIGSAVMAGHFGVLENGEGSVFDNLKKLRKGDQIYVEDDKGANITFVVRENRSYDADADASSVFTSSDGKSHLNLVTCQGWDKVSESYTKRFVVFTNKE
jgi:LPXTG-site transpeptidase (sortase) family protein